MNSIYFELKGVKNKIHLFQFISIIFLAYICSNLLISSDLNKLIFIFAPFVFLYFFRQSFKSIFILFILTCYVNYFIYLNELPRFLTWHIELCAAALFLALVGFLVFNKRSFSSLQPFFILLSLFLIIHLISFYSNNQSLLRLLMACRKYYIFLAIFLAIVGLPGDKKFYEKFIKLMIFTMFIQIPISIFQYFVFNRADFMGGLFGKNSSGTISSLGIGFGFFGYYLYRYYKRKKVFLFSGIGMIIPLILAEAKFGMIFLPFAYIYNFILEKKHYVRKTFILLCLIPIYILTLFVFDYINIRNPNYIPYMQRTLEDPLYLIKHYSDKAWAENIESELTESGYVRPTMGRVASIRFAFNYIKEGSAILFFGFGPGEASQDPYLPGSLVNLGFYRAFVVISLIEWGIVGTSVWLLIFFYLFIINLRCLRFFQKNSTDKLWKAFCYFSNMQMFIFLFEFIYSQSFISEYKGLFFWLTNGLIVWYYQNYIKPKRAHLNRRHI